MKKLIFRAPVQTASGYGVHARMLLKALMDDGRFDITVMSVPWGSTPLLYENTPFLEEAKKLTSKFRPDMKPDDYDVSVQVTIPNEFMKLARRNVGVTAGIETDRVPPIWQIKTNEVIDMLVVPSVHSARSFFQGIYNGMKGPQQILLRKPIYILPEWIDTSVFNTRPVDPDPRWDFPAAFNFVSVGLGFDKNEGEDRKNLTQTVRWFCEQFKGNPDVGLVLKASMVNYSVVDYKNTLNRIMSIKHQTGCGQYPRIHLIHGRLGDGELAALFKHPRVKAYLTLTHGEGYGLPVIEAAACGLPVIATNWSGHLDFLTVNGKPKFVPIDAEIKPIPPGAVWKDVLDEGTMWAWPKEADAKMKMAKMVISYDRPKQWADELAPIIGSVFNQDVSKRWVQDVYNLAGGEPIRHYTNTLLSTRANVEKKLESVTLVAASDVHLDRTIRALRNSMAQISFAKAKLFTSVDIDPGDPRIEVVKVPPMKSVDDYDVFIAKGLADHLDTEHALVIQWDGYVINGSMWDDEFLKYDLVGAPWYWQPQSMNSGFMLISKKLLVELQKPEYEKMAPFDLTLFKPENRAKLESVGIKFAPVPLASKFSIENQPYQGQFGWHGENPFVGDLLYKP